MCCHGIGCLAVMDSAEEVKQHMEEAKATAILKWASDRNYSKAEQPLAQEKWRTAYKEGGDCPCGLERPGGKIARDGKKKCKSLYYTARDCPYCRWPRYLLRLTTNTLIDARITVLMGWLPESHALREKFASTPMQGNRRQFLLASHLVYHAGSQDDVACYVEHCTAKDKDKDQPGCGH